jgi:hypothetical protein
MSTPCNKHRFASNQSCHGCPTLSQIGQLSAGAVGRSGHARAWGRAGHIQGHGARACARAHGGVGA